jgi:hypothetical protein
MFGAVKVSYGLSGKRYAMCFTSERMILAKLLKYGDRDLKDKAFLAEIAAPGTRHTVSVGSGLHRGFGWVSWFIGLLRHRKRARETGEKFETLKVSSPAALLKSSRENFSIPYGEIQRMEIKKLGMVRGGTIKVNTANKEYEFAFIEPKKDFNRCVELASRVLGDRLSVR